MDMFDPFILFLIIVSTLYFLLKLNRGWYENQNLPPSPPKLPIVGNLHQLGPLLHRSLRDLSTKYGPLMLLHLGYRPYLIVSSAEMAKEIMHTHDIAFANRPFTSAAKALLYGCTDIGFAPYGEYWRQIRKIAALDLFSMKRVESFRYVREEEVSSMLNEISQFSSVRAPVNLSELIVALSNNIVSRCALGFKLDSHTKFGELSRKFVEFMGSFSVGDMYPRMGWLDSLSGLNRRRKKVSRELDIVLDQIIDEHISQRKDDDRKDFVDLLLLAQNDSMLDIEITRDNIKAIILDMFVGGSDTSSTVIEWAMAELMNKPNIMKNVQEEVRRVVGKKTKVDEDDIYQMEYLKAVIKETLRLHPPLPLLVPRQSYTSMTLNNFHLSPYTTVMVNAWAIQRDPKLWDRAEEFIPDRFINNISEFKCQDCEYVPFGSGRRGCPGMSFGVATVEFTVANLLYSFDWEFHSVGEQDMSEAFGSIVRKRIPLHLVPVSHFP